jgi:signal transduction histidine kinase
MTADAQAEWIKPAFRDHRSNDDVENIIGSREFFTADEFKCADHSFVGTFDEFGTFNGKLSIYGASPKSYKWIWSGARGTEVPFGPFKLSFAYVQGDPRSSRLEPKAYDALSKKLERLGGLYVYRDGIRILPYGDPAFDFLQFEERRSYNAGRYFFSYRRMFGAIELDSEHNGALREKAGREGFRNDRAYRQFTELLKDFFVQVAAEFFAQGGAQAEDFELGRQRIQERREQLAAREKEAEKKRKEFRKALGVAFGKIDKEHPSRDAARLVRQVRRSVREMAASRGNADDVLLAVEADAYRELDELRQAYAVRPPAGFGLPRDLRRDWEALCAANATLEVDVWEPTALQLVELFASARRDAGAKPARRDRLIDVIDSSAARQRERGETAVQSARQSLDTFDGHVTNAIDKARGLLLEAVDEASTAARNGGGPLKSDKDLARRREAIESSLLATTSSQLEHLEFLTELLGQGLSGLGATAGSSASLSGMLEEEVLDLRDRAEQDFELAQVGMATQVISHELNATIQGVRSGLRRLSVWAEANEDLKPLYDDLRGSFDHLDGYLSLFTPLQRRLRRRREPLSGRRIEQFLVELFGQRLEKDEITLKVTESFQDWTASGFRSTVYPVMVNLVDNATFWVIEIDRTPRWIKLDADGSDLLISDSGPGIPDRDRDAIWEFGFTRKPRGRGAGLHIAREVLKSEGWSITLEPSRRSRGALFRVSPPA